MGSRLFSAEYQQVPTPADGAIFRRDWLRYWRALGEGLYDLGAGKTVTASECRRITTVDLAISTKTTADYTMIATWTISPHADLILVDLVRARLEGPDLLPALCRVYERFRPDTIGIESTGYQLSLIQTARRDGLPIRELHADKNKVSRALTAAARMEAGSVFFEAGAPYLEALEDELLAFPAARHDDQVDALAYAAVEITRFSTHWASAYGTTDCTHCGHLYYTRRVPGAVDTAAASPTESNTPSPSPRTSPLASPFSAP